MSLPLPLSRHAPDDPVFMGEGDALRASELWGLAAGVAEGLPADCHEVVLACQDRALFAAALLAAWHRGLPVLLPANPSVGAVDRLTVRPHAHGVHDVEGGRGLDARRLAAAPHAPLTLDLAPSFEAVHVYTSGSTGTPTVHGKTAGQLLGEVGCHLDDLELAGARIVASVSPYHIYGLLFGMLAPLCGGGVASRSAPLMPGAVTRALRAMRADVWITVPAHLRAMLEAGELEGLGQVRVFSSAAPLPRDVADALRGRGIWLCEILGSTETGGIARRVTTDAPWRPLPGVTVAANATGAMQVSSPWLHPDQPQPYTTADRIAPTDDGGFVHRGRADRVVKVAGRRVDLAAIEALLCAQQGVREARVVARDTAGARGTELLAAVEAEGGSSAVLREALGRQLDPVTVPRRIRCVSALPRTTAGKVTDAAVRMLFAAECWQLPSRAVDDGWDLEVPSGLGHFQGHFDGLPILPGVVQLRAAVQHARARWPELGPLRRLSRGKFKAPLEPGDRLHLELKRKGEQRVFYRLTRDGREAATGVLEFALDAAKTGENDG